MAKNTSEITTEDGTTIDELEDIGVDVLPDEEQSSNVDNAFTVEELEQLDAVSNPDQDAAESAPEDETAPEVETSVTDELPADSVSDEAPKKPKRERKPKAEKVAKPEKPAKAPKAEKPAKVAKPPKEPKAPKPVEAQMNLLPTEALDFEEATIPLSEIALPVMSVPAESSLVESIAAYGVLQPIIVRFNMATNLYDVVAGRRRFDAARKVAVTAEDGEDATIPARIITYAGDTNVITLVENTQRKDNPLSELQAIVALQKLGASEKDIQQATGFPIGSIRARMKLEKLVPELMQAVTIGTVSMTAATEAARLPAAIQKKLVKKLAENGKLKVEDLRAVRAVELGVAVKTLPDDMFDDDERDNSGDDWQRHVVQYLENALALIPADDDRNVRSSIQDALSALSV